MGMKLGKLSKEQHIKMQRKIERELQIELGMNFSRNRVHKTKKDYNRQENKKVKFYED
jgi:hypothetical protein